MRNNLQQITFLKAEKYYHYCKFWKNNDIFINYLCNTFLHVFSLFLWLYKNRENMIIYSDDNDLSFYIKRLKANLFFFLEWLIEMFLILMFGVQSPIQKYMFFYSSTRNLFPQTGNLINPIS